MFKLVTGLPGGGKTSNELWNFLNAPEYNGRPKYCTPVNGFEPEKHGVVAIDHISCWESLPDGSVIFCDEVQDYGGTDVKGEPQWVKQLARHRHRGFDFICTTQSPMFLNSFIRKLAQPHVHYIRPWNMKGIQYSWESVQNDPNSRTAKNTGVRTPVKPNPEVFKLYTSTVLDTHKSRPPYKVFILLAVCILLLLVGGGWATYRVLHMGDSFKTQTESSPVHVGTLPESGVPQSISNGVASTVPPIITEPVWTPETMKPSVPGMPHSAPVYDDLTKPSDFPRVAACMTSKSKGCHCYTQQATPLEIPETACEIFVKVGTFDPWLSSRHQRQQDQQQQPQLAQSSPAHMAPRPSLSADEKLRRGASFTVVSDSSRVARSIPITSSN